MFRFSKLSDYDLALNLEEIGEIDFNRERRFKNGLLAPMYIDGRGLGSFPRVLKAVGELLVDVLQPLRFDVIAGIPLAGTGLAQAASREALEGQLEWPVITMREAQKEYGTKRMIEGRFETGQVCVVVDNVVTSSGTMVEFIRILRNEGLIVSNAVALADYEQGGRESLAAIDVNLHSVYTPRALLEMYAASEAVSADRYEIIAAYIADPLSYADNRETDAAKRAEALAAEETKERRRIATIEHGND